MRVVVNRRMKLIVDEMVCIILCSLLWVCERRELTYYMEAEVTVTADWSRAGLEEEKEEGATLIIFPQDGSAPRIVLTGEREHTTVRLPLGTYDAVFLPWNLLKHMLKMWRRVHLRVSLSLLLINWLRPQYETLK